MSLVTLDFRRCEVQPIRGDGNCLFGAVAHQIFRCTVESDMYTAITRTLREMVVEHILDDVREESLVSLITLRVSDEFPGIRGLSSTETVLNFLGVLQEDGVWGSSESLLAFARIFEIVIYT